MILNTSASITTYTYVLRTQTHTALQKEAKTITDDLGKHLKPSHLLEERLLDMVKMGGTVTEDQAALFEELVSRG